MLKKNDQKNYKLTINGDILKFSTTSFRAEKTSVLHEGVFTKEFSSTVIAAIIGVFVYMYFIHSGSVEPLVRFLSVLAVFIISFIIARSYIFKDASLEAIFNKGENCLSIRKSGILFKNTETVQLSDIQDVEIGKKEFIPENLDGIQFVQKISAGHGHAIPDLNKPEEFVTLSIRLSDDSEKIIFAAKIDEEPELPLNEIRRFLSISSENKSRGTTDA